MTNAENTQTFYYTFGTAEFYPYQKGWVEVKAEDRAHADALFRRHFPDRTPGVLNCSCVYSEEHFQKIQCHANNLPDWKICHAEISSWKPLRRSVLPLRKGWWIVSWTQKRGLKPIPCSKLSSKPLSTPVKYGSH